MSRRQGAQSGSPSDQAYSPTSDEHLPPIDGGGDEEVDNAILQVPLSHHPLSGPTLVTMRLQALPERDRTAISQAMGQFGSGLVSDIYSKKWEKRKQGLEALQRKLAAVPTNNKDNAAYLLQPTLQLLRKCLRYLATQPLRLAPS